ncbi:MAG: hypothetical protein WCD00_03315 [Desulfuromonadaceae bacterium]
MISEPSNPWVSGVSGLFSDEFYRHVKGYLQDDGLFVQWVQMYEIDMPLITSIFKTFAENFSDYTVYEMDGKMDLVIVGKAKGSLGGLKTDALQFPAFRSAVSRVHINDLQDISIRQIGSKKDLNPQSQIQIPINSDYFPFLDQHAAKARFMNPGTPP